MATVKPGKGKSAPPQHPGVPGVGMPEGRWPVWAARMLVIMAMAGAAWGVLQWSRLGTEAHLATAYGAHVACSCHYIAGRPLMDCEHDFEPGMGLVTLSADEEEHSVTARVIPLARDIATFRKGQGCVLESWH